MTIKSSLTAIIAVFSVMLIFTPTANAQEKKDIKKDEKPPVVMVTVQEGDSLSSIADTHNTTYVRIFNANDFIVNPDVINPGDKVRIPTTDEVLPDRQIVTVQTYATPVNNTTTYIAPTNQYNKPTVTTRSSSAGNTYTYGYCTYYAKQRRPDLPNMLGNGGQWVANASARGLATGSVPQAGAIAETPGHVAYVESVNDNGTIVISEMNGPAGFGVVGTRTVPANQAHYIY
ncbi:MAG: CHAP domain-containing protein [Candidatus Saccharimonadales bacterium]